MTTYGKLLRAALKQIKIDYLTVHKRLSNGIWNIHILDKIVKYPAGSSVWLKRGEDRYDTGELLCWYWDSHKSLRAVILLMDGWKML